MRVLSIASEAVPLVKTGGLADVAGALPAALAGHAIEVTTLIPGYPAVLAALPSDKAARKPLHQWPSLLGQPAALRAGTLNGPPLLVLDCPALFDRPGGPYGDATGRDWPDNWRRFAALGRAGADIAGGAVPGLGFDIAHAHDWQAAMALAYLRFAPASPRPVATVMTIHNLAFQGYFAAEIFGQLGLPASAWGLDGVEYNGGVGFLKAGMQAASIVTTVSPSYAREIATPAFGMGLEGLVRSRGDAVRGLINGIDPGEWNPATDPALAANYTARSLAKRRANRRALEAEFGLQSGEGPLFIVVSRLTWQKGLDVLAECLDHLAGLGGRLALLGSGDAAIAAALQAGAARHPGRIAVRLGYDEALSHRMLAGGDAILVPSRFEPCGLTQLYGLAYGCVPVVARTGGLNDTVIDANLAALDAGVATGVAFAGVDYVGLAEAIHRTVELYARPAVWAAMQRNGMRADFGWPRAAQAYAELFRGLAAPP